VDRAAVVGRHLLDALSAVAAGRADLSTPRGWGLALAVDVVDPSTGRPDAERAGRIVEGMRERGVLIGRTGRDRAALKIRPPLVFADEHVDQLVAALASAGLGPG
jgi:4-aminobutyrate aminotransferase-like enzyme